MKTGAVRDRDSRPGRALLHMDRALTIEFTAAPRAGDGTSKRALCFSPAPRPWCCLTFMRRLVPPPPPVGNFRGPRPLSLPFRSSQRFGPN
jgi:hypothetical protein